MIGSIIGDIAGSHFEFDNHLSKDFKLFDPGVSYTDDTVMTVAVADWLCNTSRSSSSLVRCLHEWGARYPHPMGGHGDTIAAITGGIAGAFYGVPDNLREAALSMLPADMRQVIDDFEIMAKNNNSEI